MRDEKKQSKQKKLETNRTCLKMKMCSENEELSTVAQVKYYLGHGDWVDPHV
jgi:hypothetical protein